jgi:2-C-methyl-D-erythritol 2,4-cyclodiphosphate synthase
MRIGIGFDVHRLIPGRRLVLGGIEIPFTHGLEGHSDADVLLHAIADAVLGALGEGDLGRHFPTTDERFAGIASTRLLATVAGLMGARGYRLGNLDEAERLLRQALERFPDQEVAAHLGEVLWANGKQREARQIWEKFLKEQPESPILRSTIKRLTGSETL